MSLIKFGGNIPTFVKRLREDLEISQTELGNMLGVHGQYVSNVERGIHKNPIGFCSLLYQICPRDRREYLTDLIADSGSQKAVLRLKKKLKGGKWNQKSN